MLIRESNHITIKNCELYASLSSGAWAVLRIEMNSHHNKILDNIIEHRSTRFQNDAVNLKRNANYNLIQGNFIGSATHYAFSFEGYSDDYPNYTCTGNVVQNNTIENYNGSVMAVGSGSNRNLIANNNLVGGANSPYASGIHNFQFTSSRNIVRNNIFRDNTGDDGYAMSLYVHKYGNYPPHKSDSNRIYNNIITNVKNRPVTLGNYSPNVCSVRNNYFKNNIIYNNGETFSGRQLYITSAGSIEDNHFENNVFYKSGIKGVLYIKGTTYNVAEREAADPTHYLNNIQQDPDLDSNYHPRSTSPVINTGAFLTTTMNSGSGTSIPVDDASYFMDGWGIIEGDEIQLQGQTQTARITNVNYDTNTITIDRSLTWNSGQGISLPYSGSAPDIGAYEYTGGASPAPTCTYFTYSDWSDCQPNNTQTRTVISSSPQGCTGGNPIITRSCTYTPPVTYQCSDNIDNDNDGLTDMNDPGCSSQTDNDEYNTPPPRIPFSQSYETENMSLISPMTKGNDANASGGQYISPTSGTDSKSPSPEATLSFTVPQTDTYYLWVRMTGPDSGSDALYVGIDNTWDRVYPSTTHVYEWVKVETAHKSGNYSFNLSRGSHTLRIGHGEINARADALFLTNNSAEIPSSPQGVPYDTGDDLNPPLPPTGLVIK